MPVAVKDKVKVWDVCITGMLGEIGSIEDNLRHLEESFDEHGDVIMLPMPDGTERPVRPLRPVSPEVLAVIRRAVQLAKERRHWTKERTVEEGRKDLERARLEAIAKGIAIDDEREAAIGD